MVDLSMTERKQPERHPSTLIPLETVEEITYRWYLRRLEPPMTPEESAERVTIAKLRNGKELRQDDAHRRQCSKSLMPLSREYLRVLVDMGIVTP
jgi:hypothetical protein